MNYKGHLAINTAVLGGVYFLTRDYVEMPDQINFAAGYVFASFFLSPDLDLFYSTATKNWKFLRILWWPYSKLMKHRGLSHSLFLATITKLLYMSFVALSIYMGIIMLALYIDNGEMVYSGQHMLEGVRAFVYTGFELFKEHWVHLRYILLGVWVSDIAHILIGDRITSALKIILKP